MIRRYAVRLALLVFLLAAGVLPSHAGGGTLRAEVDTLVYGRSEEPRMVGTMANASVERVSDRAWGISGDTLTLPPPPEQVRRSELRQMRRDSIRARKKVWISVLGGPSYTPEASFGVGGAMLASFRLDAKDTLSQRSFLPVGFNLSLNGTVVVAGAGSFFMKENRFRIYLKYAYRDEPSNYYGKGYATIEQTTQGKETTEFHKRMFQLYPQFVWEVRPALYAGVLADVNHTSSTDVNPRMAEDPYYLKFKSKYTNIGLGAMFHYDTRDDVAMPSCGMLLGVTGKVYSRIFGGSYDYQILDFEYRHFQQVFRPRSVLAWTVRSQIGFSDIPFTELPSFGSPNDLRGYYLGKYRDKSMAYGIVEYRHMFGSEEAYRRGRFYSKLGFVVWGGVGTIGDTPAQWNRWKWNYGVGLRIQVQPRKNFRLDVGKEPGQKGMLFYMNMTEAF